MQDLILYNDTEVVIQSDGKIYQDTLANFKLDYNKDIEYKNIDYNRATKNCYLNDEPFQAYPNDVCENIIANIDAILEAKAIREYVEPEPPTPEEIQKALTNGVQSYMDTTAQTRGYDNIHTACSYVNSTDEIFRAEGTACLAWRDSVWRTCYNILDEVLAGTREIPTIEELIAELPKLVW